jgi:hypothetical protein
MSVCIADIGEARLNRAAQQLAVLGGSVMRHKPR